MSVSGRSKHSLGLFHPTVVIVVEIMDKFIKYRKKRPEMETKNVVLRASFCPPLIKSLVSGSTETYGE